MALLFFISLLLLSSCLHAQNISTSTPVPPLQWINLSPLLMGSTRPPPLRDASIGYDETRYDYKLVIFDVFLFQ